MSIDIFTASSHREQKVFFNGSFGGVSRVSGVLKPLGFVHGSRLDQAFGGRGTRGLRGCSSVRAEMFPRRQLPSA